MMERECSLAIAQELISKLEPYCQRIEIAGSIRRCKPVVKDIELVCIPRFILQRGLFGDEQELSVLDELDLSEFGTVRKRGEKYKQIELKDSIKLDLFIVTAPAQWGVIYAIRTGPSDFSKWLVTKRKHGGALPSYAQVRDGAVWVGDECLTMSEEIDFLEFCGVGWIEPRDRVARLDVIRY